MAARHHEPQVFGEYYRIQRIALEAAAQKERAAFAHEPSDHRHIEIHAGGNMRHRETLTVDDVRQQQIIHVTAVAGNVNDFRAIGDAAQVLDVFEFHAVVQ